MKAIKEKPKELFRKRVSTVNEKKKSAARTSFFFRTRCMITNIVEKNARVPTSLFFFLARADKEGIHRRVSYLSD